MSTLMLRNNEFNDGCFSKEKRKENPLQIQFNTLEYFLCLF